MSEGTALEDRQVPSAPQCRHHWIIDTPQGETSWGVCKLCGARKEFPNAASDCLYEGGAASGIGRPDGDWLERGPSRSYSRSFDSTSPGDDF